MKLYLILGAFLLPALTHGQGNSMTDDFTSLPQVKWRFKTRAPVFSSPVADGNMVYFGSLDSTLYAVDINTGKVTWTFVTGGPIRSNVVINKNQLLFVSPHGILYSLEKNTGKVTWRKIFDNSALYLGERKYDFADYYQSTPVIHNNVIYFGSGNNYFNAVNADNGELIWMFKANDIIHNSPVVCNNKVYFGCFDGNVYALNMATGSLAWKFKTLGHRYFPNGEVEGSPAVAEKFGMIYIGARDYNFYALDANRGTCNWNRKFDAGWALSANLKDSVIYVGTADDKALIAYDALYGKQLWRTDVKSDIFGGCAFTSSMVYVGTFMGKFYGIDRRTGALRWVFTTDAHAGQRAKYLKEDDSFRDDIYKILKAPADLIAIEYDMGGIYSTPLIYNDQIFITTTEGTMYCLKK